MIGLVAFDLILRFVDGRTPHMALVFEIARMDLGDTPADLTGLGIPGDMIATLNVWLIARSQFSRRM